MLQLPTWAKWQLANSQFGSLTLDINASSVNPASKQKQNQKQKHF